MTNEDMAVSEMSTLCLPITVHGVVVGQVSPRHFLFVFIVFHLSLFYESKYTQQFYFIKLNMQNFECSYNFSNAGITIKMYQYNYKVISECHISSLYIYV